MGARVIKKRLRCPCGKLIRRYYEKKFDGICTICARSGFKSRKDVAAEMFFTGQTITTQGQT